MDEQQYGDAERDARAVLVDELDFYYGEGSAAIRHRGMDPGAGGGGQVHDEAVHDALLMAPLDRKFRYGLWKLAWIELALGALPRTHTETLRVAFTPRRWHLLEDSRSHAAREHNELSHVEARLRKHMASGTCIVTCSTIDDRGRPHIERRGVSLLALAIESGAVRDVHDAHPAIVATREAHPDFTETTIVDLLAFLEKMAENTAVAGNHKVSGAAESTLAKIRKGTEARLAPAFEAYAAAAASRDPERHPDRVGRSERRRRYQERMAELFDRPRAKEQARARALQGLP